MKLSEWFARIKVPHVFTLLVGVIAFVSLLSWVVPSGEFAREEVKVGVMTKNVVVPGSFAVLEKFYTAGGALLTPGEVPEGAAAPVSLQGFLSAIPRGLTDSGDIIFFIFIMGGVFGILQRTGTVTATLGRLTDLFADRAALLVILLCVAMGIGGSTLGMGEEFIPLVPMFLILSRKLGYDRLFGLSVIILGGGIGFAAATTNPFTVNIAQNIAELPLNSGWELRVVFFVFAMTVTLIHILRYGARVKKDPSASLLSDLPDEEVDAETFGEVPDFTGTHAAILALCTAVFVGIMVAVQQRGWWLDDMAGGFFLMGILAAVVGRLSPRVATEAFADGMKEMVIAALVVGFARGIVVVMMDAQILDTVIHGAASLLDGASPHVGVQGMLAFQTSLNLFIPSGSGQAAVTMPLMAPLADLLGITRQTAVFAYQCGDGFSNMVIPTSGTLMAMLLMAKVPYDRWLRFAMPLVVQLLLLSGVFLAGAVAFGYS
ncbi:MAG: putative basic amino acid antiporter YfcC [Proteobacteria bacterium]|nr:putative basic amino acid antiporter YfcC [Pseudomonadota bacterium]MCP4917345.1 putative basic amino acid antiporter YfcC [Pseudomonadota bacterium]